jgi:ParB-like nuclease family protein
MACFLRASFPRRCLSSPSPLDSVLEIPLDSLDANPYQTRTSLDEKSMQELSHFIRSIGLLEPIVVRANGGGRCQVIAGERRVKACYMAGVYKVPAVVRQVTDQQAAAMTVIENLLREDVSPLPSWFKPPHFFVRWGGSKSSPVAERKSAIRSGRSELVPSPSAFITWRRCYSGQDSSHC